MFWWPKYLSWQAKSQVCPLPENVRREYVETPLGRLELLISRPSDPSQSAAPILFIHGGFGHAGVWTDWMTDLRQLNYPGTCYSISLRGHGDSWYPTFLRMYFFTTKKMLAYDLQHTLTYIKDHLESGNRHIILAGHSSGGGLSQYLLSENLIPDMDVLGLGLIDSIPNFGSREVYWNWFKLDPYFPFATVSTSCTHARLYPPPDSFAMLFSV